MVVFLCFLQLNSQKLTCALKRLVGRHTVPFEMVPFLKRNLLLAASSIYSLSLKPTVPKLLREILWRGHPPPNLACPSLHPANPYILRESVFFSPQRIRFSRKRPQHSSLIYLKITGSYNSSNHMVQHMAKTEDSVKIRVINLRVFQSGKAYAESPPWDLWSNCGTKWIG